MTDVERVRHQYTYDPETGEFRWRNPPLKAAHAKAAPGSLAGTNDNRHGGRVLRFGGKLHRAGRLAWLYVYGEWPKTQVLYRDPQLPWPARDRLDNLRLAGSAESLTQEHLRSFLNYNPETGIFTWRHSRKGVRAGSVAASLKNTSATLAYLYIRIDRVDYAAQRLAWLYVNGMWPESRLTFSDGNPRNCAIGNLVESGFEHGTRSTPTISREERKTRHAAAYRRHDLKRKFDLTAAEYQQIYDAQEGLCAVCGQPETATRNEKVRWLAVDHDHESGVVRELLCNSCNAGLGHFGDDPGRLRAAAAYVEKHAALAAEEAA